MPWRVPSNGQLGDRVRPQAPHGGIQWSGVDRDIYGPIIAQQLPAALADKPELLHRLTD